MLKVNGRELKKILRRFHEIIKCLSLDAFAVVNVDSILALAYEIKTFKLERLLKNEIRQ